MKKLVKNTQDRERKPFSKQQSKAIYLYLFGIINPSKVQNHFFRISTPMNKLKKIGQQMLKIESGKDCFNIN